MYWFLDEKNKVLYVGKAKNLNNRVRSYSRINQLLDRTKQLVLTAHKLKFMVLESELEALLTEAELIRTYQPDFNVLLKDDKSPIYIHITNEDFPRVLRVRKKELQQKKLSGDLLGPFSSGYKVNEVLKLVRPIFPWCNGRSSRKESRSCFYYHLGLCPGACVNKVSKSEYHANILRLKTFLKGKKSEVVKQLQEELNRNSQEKNYEAAAVYRDQINLIKEVTDPARRLKPELTAPGLTRELRKDGINYLKRLLADYQYYPSNYPLKRIEGYDVSNVMGTNAAVSMVVFSDGEPDKSEYRLFNIKTLNTPNDYQMMKEALFRRQNHPEWDRPDLVVVDGGKGQVRAALRVWSWGSGVVGIVKNPDRIVIPKFHPSLLSEKRSEVLKNLQYKVVKLKKDHPALKLLQQVRDESHRFSKKQHTKLRTRDVFRNSSER